MANFTTEISTKLYSHRISTKIHVIAMKIENYVYLLQYWSLIGKKLIHSNNCVPYVAKWYSTFLMGFAVKNTYVLCKCAPIL